MPPRVHVKLREHKVSFPNHTPLHANLRKYKVSFPDHNTTACESHEHKVSFADHKPPFPKNFITPETPEILKRWEYYTLFRWELRQGLYARIPGIVCRDFGIVCRDYGIKGAKKDKLCAFRLIYVECIGYIAGFPDGIFAKMIYIN